MPPDATDAQKARHARGEGGELTPVLCVDKTPEQIESFDSLVAESMLTGKGWQIVFVAALADQADYLPGNKDLDEAFQRIVQMIKYGTVSSLLAFDRAGDPVVFSAA